MYRKPNSPAPWWHQVLYLVLLALMGSACNQVMVRVEGLPANTPPDATIFVAGNFNNWQPGDRKFRLEKDSTGAFFIRMPQGSGLLRFNFNRGDWKTIETDLCGGPVAPREIVYDHDDTVNLSIASWKDMEPLACRSITLVVKSIPHNTPFGDSIAILGTFNNWDASSGRYTFRQMSDGSYHLRLDKLGLRDLHEFKFSRGSTFSLEGDRLGGPRPNRALKFGTKDTLVFEIASWEDLYGANERVRTLIISKLPSSTPANAEVYLAGNFNGWYPRDPKYRFQPNKKGQLMVQFPRKDFDLEFKVTRGDWSTQEVDDKGNKISNRQWRLSESDTLFVEVRNWFDLMASSKESVRLIVNRVPQNTPAKDELYLFGNFNDWKAGDPRYQFERRPDGTFLLNMRRNNSDLNFKLNRGSEQSTEVDRHGNNIVQRLFRFGSSDSLFVQVENWLDLAPWKYDKVTVVLLKVPHNTPPHSDLYVMGNFNNWNPKDEKYKLKRNRKGEFSITLPRQRNGELLEFKFTRGSKEAVEVDEFGAEREKHLFNFAYTDNVYLEIFGWKDL